MTTLSWNVTPSALAGRNVFPMTCTGVLFPTVWLARPTAAVPVAVLLI